MHKAVLLSRLTAIVICSAMCLGFGGTRAKETGDLFKHKRLVETRIPPEDIVPKGDDSYFVAFNKAAFGTIEVEITSDNGGRIVEVHFGEKLADTHTVDRNPPGTIRHRKATMKLKKGNHLYRVKIPRAEEPYRNYGGDKVSMPDYIGEVVPFRYCEIVNCPSQITKEDIRQVMVHYPFDDDASYFKSSNDTLNQVWELCKYSIKATTFCGLYVDGDRERRPYEADAYINQLCHYCVDDEYGMAHATQEYFIEHPTWPTEWLLHSPLMAWAEYMYTGDISFSRKYYDDLKLRVLLDLAQEDGLISTKTGLVTDELLSDLHSNKIRDIVDWPRTERDNYELKKLNTVVNAFHYRSLVVMGKIARVLNKNDDAEMFDKRAKKVYKSFNQTFWDEDKGLYVDGEGSNHSSLHANMFPLAFELVPEERQASVVDFIKSRGMACSVYGAQYLLEALYQAGADEHAIELMTAKGERSWWNMMEVGSTITLEAWDRKFKGNLDWNHAWGAPPANIIPRFLMGIRPLEPGFKKVLIKPQPGNLESASVKLPTVRGAVCAEFDNGAGRNGAGRNGAGRNGAGRNGAGRNGAGRSFQLKVRIPAKTTARIEIPRGGHGVSNMIVNGIEKKAESRGKFLAIEVGPGEWNIACTKK